MLFRAYPHWGAHSAPRPLRYADSHYTCFSADYVSSWDHVYLITVVGFKLKIMSKNIWNFLSQTSKHIYSKYWEYVVLWSETVCQVKDFLLSAPNIKLLKDKLVKNFSQKPFKKLSWTQIGKTQIPKIVYFKLKDPPEQNGLSILNKKQGIDTSKELFPLKKS